MSKLSIFPEIVLWQQQLQNFYVCMHHGPTELDDKLRAFQELSVSIVDLTDYFFSGRHSKSAYISSFICMFSN